LTCRHVEVVLRLLVGLRLACILLYQFPKVLAVT
jgi:hypothetical protein